MSLHRRSLLIGSVAIAASLSGCSDLFSRRSPTIDLAVANYTGDRQPLEVELLDANADRYGDALVFDREFEVPPPGDGETAGVVREHDVVPRRRYLVRVLLKFGDGQWRHHHFYPGEETTDPESEEIVVGVYRDEDTDDLSVRFL